MSGDKKSSFSDGCVFCRRGVVCRLPAAEGDIPRECAGCGWYPKENARRILELRRSGSIWPPKPAGREVSA